MNSNVNAIAGGTLLYFLSPSSAGASGNAPLPFLPDKERSNSGHSNDVGSFSEGLAESINAYAPEFSLIFSTILAIMFLIGVIKMSYSLVTKTGMVLKGSTGMLIGIPIFVISIRLFFILLFTTNTPGVTLLINDIITLLTKTGFFAAIGMVLIGILMQLFYKFLNHPEYARWSKRLFIGSGTLAVLTAIMPMVIQGI